jgi:hypothetical protein
LLQSYFDGELSAEAVADVSSHLASCSGCLRAAREMESENLLLSAALEPEFTAAVPTERLRHRVDGAIAGLQVVKPGRSSSFAKAGGSSTAAGLRGWGPHPHAVPVIRGWLQSIADLFTLSPQRAFGYAGLVAVLVFTAIVGIVQFRNRHEQDASVGRVPQLRPPAPGSSPLKSPNIAQLPGSNDTEKPSAPPKRKTVVAAGGNNRQAVAQVKLLPGERSYLKQIASLDTTMSAESDRPMRPGLQAEYERNLALVNRAIAATRTAAKGNPNDPDAAEFMFAAYQSKVDLLNQVADARLSNRPR